VLDDVATALGAGVTWELVVVTNDVTAAVGVGVAWLTRSVVDGVAVIIAAGVGELPTIVDVVTLVPGAGLG
jgi:hypothetical protein